MAIVDFDVHHGNGTEACVRNVHPTEVREEWPCGAGMISLRSTSFKPWLTEDVGGHKAELLANHLYAAIQADAEPHVVTLSERNARKLLKGSGLIVDAFDNTEARQIVTDTAAELGLPCLHVGLAADYAEIIWNDRYRVPQPTDADICDYPLARNLVMFAVTAACEAIFDWARDGTQTDWTVTLKDRAIRPMAR